MNTNRVRNQLNFSTAEYELSREVRDIRDSVKAYMDWNQQSNDYYSIRPIFDKNKELAEFYDNFLEECILQDIESLKYRVEAIEEEEE